ncbi:hypothetical protein ADUPG1_008095, partial [Aduncisulcus paluster]
AIEDDIHYFETHPFLRESPLLIDIPLSHSSSLYGASFSHLHGFRRMRSILSSCGLYNPSSLAATKTYSSTSLVSCKDEEEEGEKEEVLGGQRDNDPLFQSNGYPSLASWREEGDRRTMLKTRIGLRDSVLRSLRDKMYHRMVQLVMYAPKWSLSARHVERLERKELAESIKLKIKPTRPDGSIDEKAIYNEFEQKWDKRHKWCSFERYEWYKEDKLRNNEKFKILFPTPFDSSEIDLDVFDLHTPPKWLLSQSGKPLENHGPPMPLSSIFYRIETCFYIHPHELERDLALCALQIKAGYWGIDSMGTRVSLHKTMCQFVDDVHMRNLDIKTSHIKECERLFVKEELRRKEWIQQKALEKGKGDKSQYRLEVTDNLSWVQQSSKDSSVTIPGRKSSLSLAPRSEESSSFNEEEGEEEELSEIKKRHINVDELIQISQKSAKSLKKILSKHIGKVRTGEFNVNLLRIGQAFINKALNVLLECEYTPDFIEGFKSYLHKLLSSIGR